jgi:hypothetical protein
MANHAPPAATPDGVVDHLPACKERCVHGCRASQPRAFETWSVHYSDAPRQAKAHGRLVPFGERVERRIRTIQNGSDRAAPPLWERVDDWGCLDTLRAFDVPVPSPEAYPDRVADDHYNLDRWTRADGVADRELDATIQGADADRKSRARAAPDVGDIAEQIRTWFPGIETNRTIGHELPDGGGIFVGFVWGLALWLFGREHDPLPEHAIGRMLPGVPVREVRAPFSSPVGALYTAARSLPDLGGGALSFEIAMPKRRTWSTWEEIKVHSSHGGTSHVRGEQAVNRCLSARSAIDRAALSPCEQMAVDVLSERGLLHDERSAQLRSLWAQAHGIEVPSAGHVAREKDIQRFEAPERESEREAITKAQRSGEDVKARLGAWEKREADRLARLRVAEEADKAAYPKMLRQATADVPDGELFAWAKAAKKRLATAVRRVTRYHDPLVSPKSAVPRPRFSDVGEVQIDLAAAPPGLAL